MRKHYIRVMIIMINIVIIFSLAQPSIVYAEKTAIGDYQYIYDYNGKKICTIKVTSHGEIFFYGKHAKSGSTYTYHTIGFTMTLDKTEKNPLNISNRVYIQRKSTDETDTIPRDFRDDRYSMDIYRLEDQDVISGLVHLLKIQGYSTQKAYKKIAQGVDVYFSNIFEVVERSSMKRIGTEEYYSYQDIIDAIYELKGQHWSEDTVKLLNSYYDNIINIRLSPFFYDVIYVDSTDYAQNGSKATSLKQGPQDQEIYFGQYTGYELPSNEIIELKNKQYKVQSADYVYDSGQVNTANKPTVSNGEVAAYHGIKENATLYILLEPSDEIVTPTITPQPKPTSSSPVAPVASESTISYFTPDATAKINVQPSPQTGYDATIGVPTTEKLYGSIQTSEYLLNIVYEKKSGKITYPITVQKTYNVTTKVEDTEEESNGSPQNSKAKQDSTKKEKYKTTSETVEQTGTVTRAYSYTEIVSIDYYKIKDGELVNQTLPGQSLTIEPQNYSVPSLSYQHYSGQEKHIIDPMGVKTTIVLPSESVSSLPSEDLVSMGAKKIGQIKVRSDYLSFDGTTALNSEWTERAASTFKRNVITAPQKTAEKILYEDNQLIEKTLQNKSYPSSGTITYEKVVKFNSKNGNSITFPIDSVNQVKIHTPVYCKPVIENDNAQYLQLMNPDQDAIPLILDENPATGDFVLQISNEGYHSDKTGYGDKNYTKYLASKNGVRQNEVKFPVDMYQDIGNDGKQSNDILIKADTWSCIGVIEQRFYVPMWVKEGIYTAEIRSVAVNGSHQLSKTQEESNASVTNYVATNSFKIQMSGRLYGLTMYDISDYPMWETVFRAEDGLTLKANEAYTKQIKAETNDLSMLANGVTSTAYKATNVYDYTIGCNNSYGINSSRQSNFTMPLMIGAHPKFTNQGMIKTGYTMRFRVNTNGDAMAQDGAKIVITPRFYYVDAKGKERMEVDLYYKEKINEKNYSLVQVGSSVDQSNIKSLTVGNVMLSIPEEELIVNANLQGVTKAKLKAQNQEVYSYNRIQVGGSLRMFSNLAFAKKYKGKDYAEEDLQKLKQTYYFSYSLPDKVKAVEKGTDIATYAKQKGINFKEDFWLKDGYLIVNFDVTAVDASGNVRYSYINKDNYVEHHYCSMWLTEGGAVKKTDSNDLSIQFLAGDALLFSTNETASDDFSSDGIY